MCGRYTLATPAEDLQRRFEFSDVPHTYTFRYNIAPTQDVWVAVLREDGVPAMETRRWGLIPFWAKDPSIGNRLINARAESVAEKPAFRDAFRKRRCLILADGFYEWRRVTGGKVPMRVRLASREPFAMAGLWERWGRNEGAALRTCTILTTTANPYVSVIHDRMPVLLGAAAAARWLDPDAHPDDLRRLLEPWASDDLEAYEVSTLVNSPSNDIAECLDPA